MKEMHGRLKRLNDMKKILEEKKGEKYELEREKRPEKKEK